MSVQGNESLCLSVGVCSWTPPPPAAAAAAAASVHTVLACREQNTCQHQLKYAMNYSFAATNWSLLLEAVSIHFIICSDRNIRKYVYVVM